METAHCASEVAGKCHQLQRQVWFLGHIISGEGVSDDPGKIEVITNMRVQDLMEDDGFSPSVQRIKSFLGMVFYYQHFIPDGSSTENCLLSQLGKRVRENQHRAENSRAFIGGLDNGVLQNIQSADGDAAGLCCICPPQAISLSHLCCALMHH